VYSRVYAFFFRFSCESSAIESDPLEFDSSGKSIHDLLGWFDIGFERLRLNSIAVRAGFCPDW